jgi:hypothetical protein
MLTTQVSAPIPAEVVYRGWSHGHLPLPSADEWEEFTKFWDDLPRDAYVKPDHGSIRFRRLGRLLVLSGQDGEPRAEILPHYHFLQAKSVNSVYGGQLRVFAPILPETYDNGYFRAVLGRDLAMIRGIAPGDARWLITVHAIRTEAGAGASSAPAPEGRHSDGHDLIVLHLIGRKSCAGGESSLYRNGDRLPVMQRTLQHAMETLVINDRAMEHAVSPITASEGSTAIRDMMIVDFERTDDGVPASIGSISLGLPTHAI